MVENIESLVFSECNEDARNKQYRDKNRQITQKLKGSRMADTRTRILNGELAVATFVTDEYLSGNGEKIQP
jgi:hypothetical protein